MHLLPCLALFATRLFAQSSDAGTAEFVWTRNLVSARSAGFVNAWLPGDPDGLSALGLNPAGMARSSTSRLEIGGRLQSEGTSVLQLAGSRRFLDGVVAARLDHQSVEPIDGMDEDGEATGVTYHPNASQFVLGFAEPLGQRLAWGIDLELVREDLDIDGAQAWGAGLDLGTVLQPGSRRVTWYAQVQNLGTKLSGHTETEQDYGNYPLTFAGGVRYAPPGVNLRGLDLFLDLQKPVDNEVQIRAALEHRFNRWLQVRAAFRTDAHELAGLARNVFLQRSEDTGPASMDQRWSTGLSLDFAPFRVDYAFQWWESAPIAQHLTFAWDYGSASTSSANTPAESSE